MMPNQEMEAMQVNPMMSQRLQRGGTVAKAIPAEVKSQTPSGITRF